MQPNYLRQVLFAFLLILTLALLSSCSKREDQYEQDLINSCYVEIMSDNSVTTYAYSTCSGKDTSFTINFGVAMCINIANLPSIDDVRYDDYEFYAMVNGRKIKGTEGIRNQINPISMGIIEDNITFQLSGHNDLAVYLLHENMYTAKFFVEDSEGQTFELRLNNVY
jgi:hypothetical protein